MGRLSEFCQMATNEEKIHFHYPYGKFHFPHRRSLKSFLLGQLKKEGRSVETINYIFCSDDDLLRFNRQYLKHNTLTDIITFELSAKKQPILSDVYISIDRVKENAGKYGTSFSKELKRVIFHGALHLSGYLDKTDNEASLMRRKENEWIDDFLFHVEQTKKKD